MVRQNITKNNALFTMPTGQLRMFSLAASNTQTAPVNSPKISNGDISPSYSIKSRAGFRPVWEDNHLVVRCRGGRNVYRSFTWQSISGFACSPF